MIVYDFCNCYVEDSEEVEIYDLNSEKTVFKGNYNDAQYSDFDEEEICSFGVEHGIIVINIEL